MQPSLRTGSSIARARPQQATTCAGWERRRDDPGVAALRATLRLNNGTPDLETCTPDQVERAAELFHRDGFVVVTPMPMPRRAVVLAVFRTGIRSARPPSVTPV